MNAPGARLATMPGERLVVGVALVNVTLFSVLVTGQWAVWSGLPAHDAGTPVGVVLGQAALVLAVTSGSGATPVLLWWSLARRARALRRLRLLICAVSGAAGAALVALVLPWVAETTVGHHGAFLLWLMGAASFAIAIGTALAVATLAGRFRRAERARIALADRAARAVAQLEQEEVRVRRLVADRLHGTIQNRLVIVGAGLTAVAADLDRDGDDRRAAEVRRWVDDLEDLRERHVRTVSHALFPTGANVGMVQAVQVLLSRLPSSVATELDVRQGARDLLDPSRDLVPVPVRLTAVYAVEEAVTNALKHGARAVRVVVDLVRGHTPGEQALQVVVEDDGTGLPAAPAPLNGLERHRARVLASGGVFVLAAGADRGARLTFTLPVGGAAGAADGARLSI